MADKQLSARPGWAQLTRAADELHAAELLLGDPIASPSTALPHLRAYWQAIVEAGVAAGLGKREATELTADTWLDGELPAVSARARTSLIAHVRTLDADTPPSDKQLRAHARAARELLTALEPIIGGAPLHARKRRIMWAFVGTTIVVLPVLAYVALNREVEGDGPWRAEYFTDRKLEASVGVQRESDINHDWGKEGPLEAVPPDKFSVRWDTCLQIDSDGPVVFQIHANDGARAFLDGQPLIDAWEKTAATRRRGFGSAELELTAGIHHLRVEYFESLGTASIRVAASFDGDVPGDISGERLLYPGDSFDEQDPCAAVR